MPCLDRENERAGFVDGSLGPPAQRAFEAHLAACPSCRAACESLSALRLALRGLPAPPVRPDFEAAVLSAWDRRRREARQVRWTLAFAVTLSSLVAVLLLGNVLRLRGSDPVLSYLSGGWELSSTPGYGELFVDHQARLKSESP